MSLLLDADPIVDAGAEDPAAPISSWYPPALLYHVCVEAFCDANHDGVGDFEGLALKLGYLQSLGVTCVDVVPPGIASGGDFMEFRRAAGRTGIRVLVRLGARSHRQRQAAALWLDNGADGVVLGSAGRPDVPVRRGRQPHETGGAALFAAVNATPVPCGHCGEAIEELGAFRAQVLPALVEGLRRESGIPLLGLVVRLALRMAAGRLRRRDEHEWGGGGDAPWANQPPLRLARLTDGPGPRLDLLHALLFALPGPPLLVFGDEIGMDDPVRDADGGWSPMRWRRGQDGDAISVESQSAPGPSLLNRVRELARLRRGSGALSCGTASPVGLGGGAGVGFLRECGGETVLVVANLSHTRHTVECDLSGHEGKLVEDLVAREQYAPVLDARYPVDLPPYGWHWLRLGTARTAT